MQLVAAGAGTASLEPVSMTAMFFKIIQGGADSDDCQRYIDAWDSLAAALSRRAGKAQDSLHSERYGQPHLARRR